MSYNSKTVQETHVKEKEAKESLQQFIQNILHQQVEIEIYNGISKLPLTFQGSFDLYVLTVNGQSCILAEPKETLGLVVLRKQQRRLERLTGQYCVLYLKILKAYTRDKMLEEGIPFIWENHQIYMPFLGILLKQNEARSLKHCTKISFLTQKMLLTALYDQWQNITVTMAADRLGVSKMSVTRCFDELEELEIPVIYKRGRARVLCGCGDKKEMWYLIQPYMRTPMLREFCLKEDLGEYLMKSGMSALCEYSMLSDNEYRTYAIVKTQFAECDVRMKKQVPQGEMPGCIVQELGYMIKYKDFEAIDPLTVYLLMEKEREEPRVDKALEEMLEGYVW